MYFLSLPIVFVIVACVFLTKPAFSETELFTLEEHRKQLQIDILVDGVKSARQNNDTEKEIALLKEACVLSLELYGVKSRRGCAERDVKLGILQVD